MSKLKMREYEEDGIPDEWAAPSLDHDLMVQKDNIEYSVEWLGSPRLLGSIDMLSSVVLMKERSIYSRIRDGVIPHVVSPAAYDILMCTRSYIRYLKDKISKKFFGSEGISVQRERNIRYQADTRALKLDIMKADVVKKESVDLAWSDVAKRVQNKLLSVRSRLRWEIEGKTNDEILDLVDRKIHEALGELRNKEEKCFTDPMYRICESLMHCIFSIKDGVNIREDIDVKQVKDIIGVAVNDLDDSVVNDFIQEIDIKNDK